MLLRRRFVILPLIAALGPAFGQASIEGQTFDATARVAGSTLLLNGVGVRAVAWFKGYAAGLYLAARAVTPDDAVAATGPKRLQMRMLVDVPAAEFVKAIDKGMDRNTPPQQHALLAERRAAFEQAVTAVGKVRKGDVVNLDYVPGSGLVFTLNGTPHGDPIAGEDFYAALLLIFVGPKPVDTRLKAGLLGAPA